MAEVEFSDLSNKAIKSAQLLNFACANRKALLDKDMAIIPPSLRVVLNSAETDTKDTTALINHILKKKSILDSGEVSHERKLEYGQFAQSTDELCSILLKLTDTLQ